MNIDNFFSNISKPVAIIGIGMRFPANARTEEEMWNILIGRHCKISEIPPDRWSVQDLSHPERGEPGRSVNFKAGALDKIDEFDAAFFGISPREAAWMDPQQRMLLEMAHDAMENAGILPENMAGSSCGVYVGISGMDYGQNALTDLASMSPWSMTGNTLSIAANRISWVYNLQGPSLAIDTACSSSLAAIHQACQALRNGEIPLALAGGINVLMHPYAFIGFSHASMLSAKGECRPFDAAASGYVRGEGGALLLLKPLDKALEDGDNIHAVILGTGINSDGSRKSGLTIPSAEAQAELMERVLKQSGLNAEDLDFVEAHGTGTPVGDPVEANSIGLAYGKKRRAPLPISSVKANFGHLEPASGVAGMIKAILALKHEHVPPMPLDFHPNPAIPFTDLNIFCAYDGQPLNGHPDRPHIGAVNSFGFGGLNAHIILATPPKSATWQANKASFPALFLSAGTDAALRNMAGKYAALLDGATPAELANIQCAAALNRSLLEKRLAIWADTPSETISALQAFASGNSHPAATTVSALPRAGGMAFIYSGNGSQWAGMGKQLLEESEDFRHAIEELDKEFLPLLGWSIKKALQEATPEFMEDTTHAQPLLFAMQVALTTTLEKMGISPDAAIGHSVGEIAAAWAAGKLSLSEAIQIVNARSLAQGRTKGLGKMAAVGLGMEDTQTVIDKAGLGGSVEIAAANSPLNCTISGKEEAIDCLEEIFAKDDVFFRRLNLDYAFHSKAMDQEAATLASMLADLNPANREGPVFISTVSAEKMPAKQLDAAYWWQNMRHRVEFAKAINALHAEGMRIFVEIGPHAVLQRYIRESLGENSQECRVLPLMQKENADLARVRQVAATLHMLAGRKAMQKLFGSAAPHVSLPLYTWQKERHTFPKTSERLPQPIRKWPLLGWELPGAEPQWENILDPRKDKWLEDHRIAGSTVLAAAAWLEIALEAARAWLGSDQAAIEKLAIELPLIFENNQPQTLRTVINSHDGSFRILSRPRLADGQWTEHAKGRIVSISPETPLAIRSELHPDARKMGSEEFYELTTSLDLEYGPFFRRIASIQFAGNDLEAGLKGTEKDSFALNPGAIDACFHSLAALYSGTLAKSAYLPVGVDKAFLYSSRPVHAIQGKLVKISRRTLLANFILLDQDGLPTALMKGCRFRQLPVAPARSSVGSWKTLSRFAPLPRKSAPAYTGKVGTHLKAACENLEAMNGERTLWHRQVLQNLEAMTAIGLGALERKYGPQLALSLPSPLVNWLDEILPEPANEESAEMDVNWLTVWKEIRQLAPCWLTSTLPLARLLTKLPELAKGRKSLEELYTELQSKPDSISSGYTHPAWHGAEILVSGIVRGIVAEIPAGEQLVIRDFGPWPSLLEHEIIPLQPSGRIDFQSEKSMTALTSQPGQEPAPDIVIVRNLLHSVQNLASALKDIFNQMQPGGLLVLEERYPDWSEVVLEGLRESWWRKGADRQALPARMSPEEWRLLLIASGFENITIQLEPAAAGLPQGAFVVLANKAVSTNTDEIAQDHKFSSQSWRLIADDSSAQIADQLMEGLEAREQKVESTEFSTAAGVNNIIYLPSAANQNISAILEKTRQIALAMEDATLWLVTRSGSLAEKLPGASGANPLQATLTGFARVFNNESHAGRINAIDLDESFSDSEVSEKLLEEFFSETGHEEVSWTRNGRFETQIDSEPCSVKSAAQRCRLDVSTPGKLDNLQWQALSDLPPGDQEIEAHVMATGLNFRDIMLTLGLLPEDALEDGFAGATPGLEFAGIVTQIGKEVKNMAPGDRIAGFASSSFASHIRTPANACAKIPESMSFSEAASLPTIFVTAWYALHYLGHIQPGETVLIHGGAGGVGLAAIQIAQKAGARVFATAGTDEKRDLLRLLGVDLVLDSRSLNFAEQILDATNGQGVDLVLNSLAGEAMRRSLRLLKPFGRFLELGKRDYVENTSIGLAPFKENISYFGIDVDQLQAGRPDLAARLFTEIMSFLEKRTFLPPPLNIFSPGRIASAFRAMQHSRHIGKIVVDMGELPEIEIPTKHEKIDDLSGSWLVSGGLSGFGLATAKHLAELGVKNLILISRHGQESPDYPKIKDYFDKRGTRLFVEACDVSDAAQVDELVKKVIDEMPPLKGLVHAAAIFDDRMLNDLDQEAFSRVLEPKLQGAINLHEATKNLPLKYFVLYSSISVAIGNPGQANYVAANAGLESLVRKRLAMNLPASCLAWGPIGDCGYLGRNPKVRAMLEKRIGARTLTTNEAMGQFDRFAAANGIHILGNADWCKIAQQGAKMPERLAKLINDAGHFSIAGSGWVDQIRTLPRHEALQKIADCVSEETAKVLNLPVSEVPADKSLPSLGLDSLMAMELATAIEQSTGLRLPAMLMQDAPSIRQIAERLYARMTGSQSDEAESDAILAELARKHAENLAPEETRDVLAALKGVNK